MYSTARLYSLSYQNTRTYLFALLFVIGNILFPQLCHLVNLGGVIMLPIFFFTLIGAYKYGLWVGLITAILSPLVNYGLFGMPPAAILPEMIFKSAIIALSASYIAKRTQRVSFWGILATILCYQIAGSGFAVLTGIEPGFILHTLKLGIPGMAFQLIGGYLLLKTIRKI